MQQTAMRTDFNHLASAACWPELDPTEAQKLNILLVEDTNADALLTRIAIEETEIPCRISRMARGDNVLPGLLAKQRLCPTEIPDVILLDLGLPGMDGFEILAELSSMSPLLRSIPIIILTAYENFEYISRNYPLCVVAHLSKPCHSADVKTALSRIRK